MTEETQDNRNRMIELAIEHNLKIVNTQFKKKQKEKIATYRTIGIDKTAEVKKKQHTNN